MRENTLWDSHNRRIEYLRVSITKNCNLRCFYCMPSSRTTKSQFPDTLTHDEFLQIINCAQEFGISKFRITGGEPLAAESIINFLEKLTRIGVDFSLTTNGILLDRYARYLSDFGISGINISLDTLKRDRFRLITGRDGIKDVFRGISTARRSGIVPIKINMVVMKGINDDEIDKFIEWARKELLIVRFIEFMPVRGGDYFYPLKPVVEKLLQERRMIPGEVPGWGPARYFRLEGGGMIGFILSRSEPFCAKCNRLRLTSEGFLLPCLFSQKGVDIKSLLRRGLDIKKAFLEAVQGKARAHRFDMRIQVGYMNQIGG